MEEEREDGDDKEKQEKFVKITVAESGLNNSVCGRGRLWKCIFLMQK